MDIADKIRKHRKLAGLTQKELAEKCNCAVGTIQQYELGKRRPRYEQIIEIAHALHTSVAELTDPTFNNLHSFFTDIPIIENGVINPDIKNVRAELEKHADTPFTILTESEKLLVYYNSLNDEGQEKAFELLELLLEIDRYRRK